MHGKAGNSLDVQGNSNDHANSNRPGNCNPASGTLEPTGGLADVGMAQICAGHRLGTGVGTNDTSASYMGAWFCDGDEKGRIWAG